MHVHGCPLGHGLILPDWFYVGALDEALVLTTINEIRSELATGKENAEMKSQRIG